MLSNIEKEFTLKVIANKQRLDRRNAFQRRPIKFTFESERGCIIVDMGKTKVMAQISWDLRIPKDSRPHDGILKCNVEVSMLAHPRYEMGNVRHLTSAHLSRLLEKCIQESRCLDLESLCLEAGVKVMCIRVDVHALNDDGNLIGAMCLAAVTALCHFKRPDISFSGGEAIIHDFTEKDPLSLTLFHIPICSNFVVVDGQTLIDPTLVEERICAASIFVASNKFREICLLQVNGETALASQQVLNCVKLATIEADQLSEMLRKALDYDTKQRSIDNNKSATITYPIEVEQPMEVESKTDNDYDYGGGGDDDNPYDDDNDDDVDDDVDDEASIVEPKINKINDDIINVIGMGGNSKWNHTKPNNLESFDKTPAKHLTQSPKHDETELSAYRPINDKSKKANTNFKSKKEKSTDCDSALIPLLCVHG